MRALRSGKAVLCEKPLGLNPDEVTAMVAASLESGHPLWEAFVFPFQEQYRRLQEEVSHIGRIRRLDGSFAFTLNDPDNVRWAPEWGGGAIYDVGCYPAHLGRLLLGADPLYARGSLRRGQSGVDIEATALIQFPDNVVMTLHCGFDGPYDTLFRILGEDGEVRVESPYHQRQEETMTVRHGDVSHAIHLTTDVPSFTPALRHIGAVIRGQAAPEHLAQSDALGTSRLLAKLLALPTA
jgi:predicted dehydrogenase